MGRRILNRKDLRADYDAAERRKEDEEEQDEEEGEEDEDEEEEGEGEAAADEEDEGEADDEAEGDEDEEEAPRKKKVVKPKAKPKAKPRSRAAKVTRMRVVWGVFNNSNQCVATYDYPKRQEAVDHASRLTADKRSTHFIQPVKEPMEEKKEKEK